MKNLTNSLRRFLASEDGPTAVEYAVMLALIIVVCLAAIQAVLAGDAAMARADLARLSEIGDVLYAPIPVGWTARGSLTTARWLNDAGVPVLVMHGKPDAVIPFALGESLYKQLRVPKEMLVSESAGHCEIASAEGERFYETVTRFVSSHSTPS